MNKALLWNEQLEWLLRSADSALGLRGTTGSVVAAIERGGVSGTGDFDEMILTRIGWSKEPGKGGHKNVKRARELGARWQKLTREQQEIAVALYVVRVDDSKVTARCGKVSGVVVFLWAKAAAARSESTGGQVTEDALWRLRAGLSRVDAKLTALYRAWPRGTDVAAFQAKSRAWFKRQELVEQTRQLRADLAAKRAAQTNALDVNSALRDLVTRCERGDVSALVSEAERAVVAAHRAWAKTGQVEAQEWVDAP